MIEHQLRLNSLGKRAALHSFYGGNAVPDLDFTSEISELLIKPLTVTSVRKVEAVGTVPLWALVWLMSELLTEPLAVVSPRRKLALTVVLARTCEFVSVTLLKLTVTVCALVTPV